MVRLKTLLATATLAAGVVADAPAIANAATLSGSISVDNQFSVYLSSSDSTLRTLITSGDDWTNATSFSGVSLTPGTTYYLHVVGWNSPITPATSNNPDSFIGSLSLTGAGFTFANGGTKLETDTADWRSLVVESPSYTVTWSAPGGAPVDLGAYGVGPWGHNVSGFTDTAAHWIWSANPDGDTGEGFFSTTILASAAPEPAAWALMLVGFGGLGAMMRRKMATAHARA